MAEYVLSQTTIEEHEQHHLSILRKMDLLMDMLRELRDYIRTPTSPTENGSELSTMNLQPADDTNGDVASCDEGSEIEVQQVETFFSTTPIAGISAASTYTTRFEETTDDIAVDGKKYLTESEVCNDVCSVFDELTESSPTVLLKAPVIEPCARYLFDELPRPFLVEQCDKNAGNVDKEAYVLPFVDLRPVLSSGYETTVNGSINGSTKPWFEGVTSIMEVVLGKNAIEDDAYKVFDEMTQTIRAVLLNEQVTDLYTNDVNFNKLILFDPGGGRISVVSFSRVVAHPLIGKGLKEVVTSPRHANSFMDTGERHCLTCSNYFFNSCSHTTFTLKVESKILHLRGGLPLSTDILDTIRNFYHVQRVTCKVLVRDLSWYDRDDYIGWGWSAMDRGLYIILEGIKDSPYYVLSICYKAEKSGICRIILFLCYSTILAKYVDVLKEKKSTSKWGKNMNAKKDICTVDLYLDSHPTSSDCGAEFMVTMPTMSFTGASMVILYGEQVVQVYCVRTQDLQVQSSDSSQLIQQQNYKFDANASITCKVGDRNISNDNRAFVPCFGNGRLEFQDFVQRYFPIVGSRKNAQKVFGRTGCVFVILGNPQKMVVYGILFQVGSLECGVVANAQLFCSHGNAYVAICLLLYYLEFGILGSSYKCNRFVGACIVPVPMLEVSGSEEYNSENGSVVRPYDQLALSYLRLKNHVHVLIHGTYDRLESFVWDPGLCAIFVYILEDKDVFERVGNDIILMDTTLVIRRYDYERQMGCLDEIGLIPKTLIFSTAELEHYIWDPGSFVSVS